MAVEFEYNHCINLMLRYDGCDGLPSKYREMVCYIFVECQYRGLLI